MTDQVLFRIGSRLAVIGAIIALAANLLHPRTLPSPSPEAYLAEIAGSRLWVVDHLGIFVGFLLIAGGLVAFSRSLQGAGAAWGRLGAALAVASLGVLGVFFAGDGIAEKTLAQAFVAAPPAERAAALHAAEALTALNFALFSVMMVLYFGLTYVVFGLAVLADGTYNRWMGAWPLLAGLAMIPVGLVQMLSGPSSRTFGFFGVFSLALTVWVLVMGIKLGRRATVR